jgi:hypothetical protein
MSAEQYVRVGQVADALHLSPYQIRKLCDLGLIETVVIQGQRSIPMAELRRLESEGAPLIPRMVGDQPPQLPSRRRPVPVNLTRHRNGHDLLAPPSNDLVSSSERKLMSENQRVITANEAETSRNLAEKWAADWDLLQIKEKFHDRDRKQADESAERQRSERRREWTKAWIKRAIDAIPKGARDEYEPAVYEQVKEQLAVMDPADEEELVRRVIDATVKKILKDWYWAEDALSAIRAGRDSLPWRLKSCTSEPSEWDRKAVEAAAVAIDKAVAKAGVLRLPFEEMRRIAVAAVADIVARQEAEEKDAETRLRVKGYARAYSLPWGLTRDEHQRAVEAIEEAINSLPRCTSEAELKAAADARMKPFRQIVAQRKERQHLEKEQQRLESEKRDREEAAARRQRDAEEVANRQRREAEEVQVRKRLAAERRADSFVDVSALYHVVAELDRNGDLDHGSFDENWALAKRLVERIRPALVDLLLANPQPSDDKMKRQVEQLVDRHLDACLAP